MQLTWGTVTISDLIELSKGKFTKQNFLFFLFPLEASGAARRGTAHGEDEIEM